ncbi:MAG: hypothetical protein IJW19_05080 [Clostridia bacterium]|nr:hypothetical protein [Clostridia bacterium]
MAKAKGNAKKRAKLTEAIKGKLKAECAINMNNCDIAEKFGIAESTVRKYRKEFEKDPDYANLCDIKKQEFIELGWDTILNSSQLVNKRIKRANKSEEEMDKLLHETMQVMLKESDKFNAATIEAFVKKFVALQVMDMSKVASILGTIYDKVALAEKQPTQNINASFDVTRFEDL